MEKSIAPYLSPDSERPRLQTQYITPRTPVEELLVGIWRELLELEHIGIYDNFFQSGGHSSFGTQLISGLVKPLGYGFLYVLFDKPTIAGLADLISTKNLLLEQEMILPHSPLVQTEQS